MRLYGFSTQNNGCGKYRIWQPVDTIKRLGLADVRREPDEPGLISVQRCADIFEWADVVHCQPFTEPVAACIMVATRDHYKKKLVVDLDDDIWAVHPMNVGIVNGQLTYIANAFNGKWDDFWELIPLKPGEWKDYYDRVDGVAFDWAEKGQYFMRQKAPDAKLTCEFLLEHADAITTTNRTLAGKITAKTGNKNVFVLPNCLNLTEYANRPTLPTDKLWLGWCGSISHYPDILPVAELIDPLMRRYPQLNIQIMGSSFDCFYPLKAGAKQMPLAGYDGQTTELFASKLEESEERWPGRMKFSPPINIQGYPDWLSTNWQSHIGIAPLEDNEFNNAKSELKWLEYSALGACTIASKVGPYRRAIHHDQDGKLCGSVRSWTNAIEELIDDAPMRLRLVEQARQRLYDDYNQERQIDKWVEVYNNV